MKKRFIYLFLAMTLQTGFAQIIPTLPTEPKVVTPKPKTVVKTKIIYRDKPAEKSTKETKTGVEPIMIFVQGGSFSMGSSNTDDDKAQPVHSVSVSSFRMSKYEVTVAQYRAYCNAAGTAMPEAPELGWKDNYPIVNVSFDDANRYCNWLSEKTGKDCRLPTEAEWEFAARGGNNSNGYIYAGSNDIDEVAWYDNNSGGEAQACGRKRPNELGLYDMTSNVYEWCSDWFDGNYYSNSPSSNPKGPSSGSSRVFRGGSWCCSAATGRVAYRFSSNPGYRRAFIGFRLVSL